MHEPAIASDKRIQADFDKSSSWERVTVKLNLSYTTPSSTTWGGNGRKEDERKTESDIKPE